MKLAFFCITVFVYFGHYSAKTSLILEFWNKGINISVAPWSSYVFQDILCTKQPFADVFKIGVLIGMLRPIFFIDINTHSHMKRKIINQKFIFLKKLFFQNVLVYIDLFYRCYYTRYFIYSNCMWRHVWATCNSITFT